MNVLQVNKLYYPHVGGIEEHVRMLSEELVDTGVNVDVLCATEEYLGSKEKHNGVSVKKSSRLATVKSVPISPTFPLQLQRLVSKNDIVHYHLPNPLAVLSASILTKSNLPSVVTYHSDIVRQERALLAYQPILDRFLNNVDRIIVTSPQLVESSSILQTYEKKCCIIPLAVDSDLVEEGDQNKVVSEGSTILFVGRLNYYKGVEYLIDAMEHINGDLLIAGSGKKANELQDRAKRLGVDKDVQFLGYVPDIELRELYKCADVFVLPSVERSEAFGIVQLEAMAHGLPVVNTNLPTGVPWVSQDGKTGRTVPPRDSEALADAINELLNEPERRAKFGSNAKERVEKKFTRDTMINDTLCVYEDIFSS